jgi:hypothetical protein
MRSKLGIRINGRKYVESITEQTTQGEYFNLRERSDRMEIV